MTSSDLDRSIDELELTTEGAMRGVAGTVPGPEFSTSMSRTVPPPANLCHKEPARASKAPYHWGVFCLLLAGSS